jgi:protein SCO1/2
MTARALRLGLAVGVLATLLAAGVTAWVAWRAWESSPPGLDLEQLGDYGRVPPFTLVERSGRPAGLDDLRGFVWISNFIYTECTETCPTQSLQLAKLQEEFGSESRLRLVSITVDPEHDTAAVLRRYADRHRATDRWWFLTGDKRAIYCLARDGFRLSVVDPAASAAPECGTRAWLGPARAWASHGSKGLFMHSARLVLVDGQARIRAYHLATEPESLARLRDNLRRLLATSR